MNRYTQKFGYSSAHLPNNFTSPKRQSHLRVDTCYQIGDNEISNPGQIFFSPQANSLRGFEPRSHKKRNKRESQVILMNNLKNQLINIKQDVSKLIHNNEINNLHYEESNIKRDRINSCESQQNPQFIFNQLQLDYSPIENRMKHKFNRYQENFEQQQGFWSQRNSFEDKKSYHQNQKLFSKKIFETSKIPPLPNQQSTHSSQISQQPKSSQTSTLQRLILQNHSNKKAIKYLQQIVYDYQQGRKQLQTQIKMLKRNSKKQSADNSLKNKNKRLSELLQRQRYNRNSLQNKLSEVVFQIDTARQSRYSSSSFQKCNCKDNNLQFSLQMKMLEQSYQSQICSLQTEIKLVKLILQNYDQKNKKKTSKNSSTQTQFDIFEYSERDMKTEIQEMKSNLIQIMSQKLQVQQMMIQLQQQNGDLKQILKYQRQNITIQVNHQNNQCLQIQKLKQQISQIQQNHILQLRQIDAYCLLLQQQNTTLKNTPNIPENLLSSFENQINTLKQHLDIKNIKIQYLQQKILSKQNTELAQLEIDKINMITQIKEIQQNFQKQILFQRQKYQQMQINCIELSQRFKQVCQEIERRDLFIEKYLGEEFNQQNIKQIATFYVQWFQQSTVEGIDSHRKLMHCLKQQNRILKQLIHRQGLEEINTHAN